MRAPFQVIVFPYRQTSEREVEYAVFFRKTERYGDFWQAISGGGEDDETPLQAARREMGEESGLSAGTALFQLESMTMLPAPQAAGMLWGPDILVVPEYAFGANAQGQEIVLSPEHVTYRWANYQTAQELLRFDSNKNALWELDYRLTHQMKPI